MRCYLSNPENHTSPFFTESETEYVVQCIKHIYPAHVVLQFDCTNTLNDQLLEDVSVALELPEGFEVRSSLNFLGNLF